MGLILALLGISAPIASVLESIGLDAGPASVISIIINSPIYLVILVLLLPLILIGGISTLFY